MINGLLLIGFIVSMQVPTITLVQPDLSQLPVYAQWLSKAVMNKDYMIIGALALMALVLFFNKIIIPKLTEDPKYKQYIPILTLFVSICTGVITYLVNPALDPMAIAMTVWQTTLAAKLSWDGLMEPIWKGVSGMVMAKAVELAKSAEAQKIPSPPTPAAVVSTVIKAGEELKTEIQNTIEKK